MGITDVKIGDEVSLRTCIGTIPIAPKARGALGASWTLWNKFREHLAGSTLPADQEKVKQYIDT
jgi:hypothetical protein